MTILDVLHDIAPEFTDDIVNARFITYAECQVSESEFRCAYDLAVAYMTAHLQAVAGRDSGTSGFTSSIKEGERSINYTPPSATDVDLMTTSYGAEFVRLKNSFVIPIAVTTNIYS